VKYCRLSVVKKSCHVTCHAGTKGRGGKAPTYFLTLTLDGVSDRRHVRLCFTAGENRNKVREKPVPVPLCPPDPGANLVLCGERLATNSLVCISIIMSLKHLGICMKYLYIQVCYAMVVLSYHTLYFEQFISDPKC
jgi:hypothetical protein